MTEDTMTDSRPRVTVDKPVDLTALAEEVGVPLSAAMEDGRVVEVVATTDTVTEADLRTAVDAHVPPPPLPAASTPEERLASLEEQVRGIRERAEQAAAAATNADAKQVGNAVAGRG